MMPRILRLPLHYRIGFGRSGAQPPHRRGGGLLFSANFLGPSVRFV